MVQDAGRQTGFLDDSIAMQEEADPAQVHRVRPDRLVLKDGAAARPYWRGNMGLDGDEGLGLAGRTPLLPIAGGMLVEYHAFCVLAAYHMPGHVGLTDRAQG